MKGILFDLSHVVVRARPNIEAAGRANKILQLDGHGKVVGSWGQAGKGLGEFQLPHMLATDADGNL